MNKVEEVPNLRRKQIAYLLTLLLTSASLILFPFLYLYRVGEYTPLPRVAKKMASSPDTLMFGSALYDDFRFLLFELMKLRHPQVISWGSSRMLKIHQAAFTVPFNGFGQGAYMMDELRTFFPEMRMVKPKIILLGLDPWWFNGETESLNFKREFVPPYEADPKDLRTFWDWIGDGLLTPVDVFQVIWKGSKDFGVTAQTRQGYAADGSFYDVRLITGLKVASDKKFENVLGQIENKSSRPFMRGTMSIALVDRLLEISKIYREEGIHLILFFTPFPPTILNKIRSKPEDYGYFETTKRELARRKILFYDYTDATQIGSNDCEFTDGLHGGDVVYLRILKDLSRYEELLRSDLNLNYIETSIKKYSGSASVPNPHITDRREVDFLELGCPKIEH